MPGPSRSSLTSTSSSSEMSGELAKYRPLSKWTPAVGDFILFNGWINRWCGVIGIIQSNYVEIITEGTPFLLFTLLPEQQEANKKKISIAKIKLSRGGEFAVLQNGVWHTDG